MNEVNIMCLNQNFQNLRINRMDERKFQIFALPAVVSSRPHTCVLSELEFGGIIRIFRICSAFCLFLNSPKFEFRQNPLIPPNPGSDKHSANSQIL
ncbi:hypothetical protein HYN43_001945 [Mucilaginibacter celer]|uniref:Uncharacterized protein n=1 Tax=Mucilaginibacter celer TaxID=2305508 RepID=A0A494VT60_9SPHI|nr:hypothetical protein HYN43_001945 [Mucilaginibacter celer]